MNNSIEIPNNMKIFLTTAFVPKMMNYSLIALLAFTMPPLSVLVALIEQYIWSPASLILVLAATIFGEVITGATKSIKIDGEKFSFKKSTRSIYIFGAHCFILTVLHNTATAYPIVDYISQGVFVWFILRNLTSILEDMVSLKWIKADFLKFFQKATKHLTNENISDNHTENPNLSESMD